MTKIEKARKIVGQDGVCDDVECDCNDENECPAYSVGCDCETALSVCRKYLSEHENISHTKTLLDEFAIAAMERIIAKRPYMIAQSDDELAMANHIVRADCRGAYSYAAAMMAERARRDEMGNIKEVKE